MKNKKDKLKSQIYIYNIMEVVSTQLTEIFVTDKY